MKQLVVVDRNEERHHDSILKGTLNFSPDSQRVAYAARVGAKQFVVVDGREERHYEGILDGRGPSFRKIEVTVSAPGHGRLHVRTRAGYLTAAAKGGER